MHSEKIIKVLGAGLTAAALTLGAAAPALADVKINADGATWSNGHQTVNLKADGNPKVTELKVPVAYEDRDAVSDINSVFRHDGTDIYQVLTVHDDTSEKDGVIDALFGYQGEGALASRTYALASGAWSVESVNVDYGNGETETTTLSDALSALTVNDGKKESDLAGTFTTSEIFVSNEKPSSRYQALGESVGFLSDYVLKTVTYTASISGDGSTSVEDLGYVWSDGTTDTGDTNFDAITFVYAAPDGQTIEVGGDAYETTPENSYVYKQGDSEVDGATTSTSGATYTATWTETYTLDVDNVPVFWGQFDGSDSPWPMEGTYTLSELRGRQRAWYLGGAENGNKVSEEVALSNGDYSVLDTWTILKRADDKNLSKGDFTVSGLDYVPMLRVYNPNGGEHVYTAKIGEKDGLVEKGWRYEGVEFYAPLASSKLKTVSRLYDGIDHHYALDGEASLLEELGWKNEGVSFYSNETISDQKGDQKNLDFKQVNLYRLYNPNAEGAGRHFYTTSSGERDALQSLGWSYEGVGFYGADLSNPLD